MIRFLEAQDDKAYVIIRQHKYYDDEIHSVWTDKEKADKVLSILNDRHPNCYAIGIYPLNHLHQSDIQPNKPPHFPPIELGIV